MGKMKETEADKDVRDAAHGVTAKELRAFVERVERINVEIKDCQDQRKEVFAEAKARGYDVKALKYVIAERKKDADARAEEQAINEMYGEALGL